MPVRVTQRSQDQEPNASKPSHNGSAQNVNLYNPVGVKIPELRRAPHSSPDLVPERKRTMPMNPAKFFQRFFSTVSQRPIRDRVIPLLALKNYRKSELLACLEREGVVEKDKESLRKILQEVANLDANENSFSLKEHFFKDIQVDWPGYTQRNRKTLEGGTLFHYRVGGGLAEYSGQKCCFFRAKLIGIIFEETASGFCLYQSCDDQEAED
ncbi:hypothetical protein DV515_00015527 [Chloebia gouldiae]|uniref:RNA polymerase II elongation factor ELL N-terminal domain-containing protein n=1 Tax=Chloebia gouldiae TaxID=44316 RepID=A0A3L8RWB5_CHLGU|nr:hypothetical protein DV515_00015527 [Chloebia gouldiae]